MRDLDLKRRLEAAGLTVVEVDGWQGRGSDTLHALGSVNHHTAGSRSGTTPSLGIVINGRPDLPGPLANVYGPREESLRVYLVAAGRANHAGRGGWNGLSGNSSVYGLEEEHCGYPDEPISELRTDRMARVHAAFLWGNQTLAANTCQHWEWTRRKVDFLKGVLDPNEFRRRVQQHLDRLNVPAPLLPDEESEVPFLARHSTGGWYLFEASRMTQVKTQTDLVAFRDTLGIPDVIVTLDQWNALVEGRRVYK